MNDNVLDITGLEVSFRGIGGVARAVNGVDLSVPRGKVVALVGESGCGKSVTSYSVLRLIQPPGEITAGKILFHGRDGSTVDVTAFSKNDKRLFKFRGDRVSMIFQEPMTALSMIHTVGNQLGEVLLLHKKCVKSEVRQRVVEMLKKVGIPAPERRFAQYPFELSGGMRQRIVIAMAMLSDPELLIADEPTTALDVTIQAQVLALMDRLRRESGTGVLLITHDLAVVAQCADFVSVMYAGRIVESGAVRDVIKKPRHPYTRGLLASLPGLGEPGAHLPSIRGTVPGLMELPEGCAFHPRCAYVKAGICDIGAPPDCREFASGRKVACYRSCQIMEEGEREDA